MTFLLLLFTGGCAFWDLKKRRIPNGMLLLGGLLFLLIRFGLGMKMGYTAGWDGRLPGYGAAAILMSPAPIMRNRYRGNRTISKLPIRIKYPQVSPIPIISAAPYPGSRPVWCRRAAAGRADFLVRAGSCRNMVACITYPAWDCQAAAYISCVLFVPVRAWGKRRAVLSGSAGWKRGIFLSGTVPVFGSDWGGADSVSVRKMACD